MPSKADAAGLVALRTALRDEAKARVVAETARLQDELAVRDAELAEAVKAAKRANRR